MQMYVITTYLRVCTNVYNTLMYITITYQNNTARRKIDFST